VPEPHLYGFHIAAGCGINHTRGEATLTATLTWCLQVQKIMSLQVNVTTELC